MPIRATILCALLAAAGQVASAESGRPTDFTFKRVGVPAPGAKRITVQIDPAEQERWLSAPKAAEPEAPADPPLRQADDEGRAAKGDFAWFWSRVPRNGLGPNGLRPALGALASPPSGGKRPNYRLDSLRAIADRHGPALLTATVGTRVSPALALAVIAVESGGRPAAVSSAGATGLMQLMPATAERFGVRDRTDPVQNIAGGVAYLDWLMERFGNDPILVLAGYNAGEGAVDRYKGVPPYDETMDYVPRVLAAFESARGLCATQPITVSDGCVFIGDRMARAD